jgi:hypothetical protein
MEFVALSGMLLKQRIYNKIKTAITKDLISFLAGMINKLAAISSKILLFEYPVISRRRRPIIVSATE